ncbi:L-glutamate gamma-semialdehyde dehydrogenase [Pseudonocardia sp.]|uniref:L-glutamate gamma-semialdehyde dehydrogenase n=1 Tax=Pseudonocardia sp. TaxID=60912 RepID=UPI003D12332B
MNQPSVSVAGNLRMTAPVNEPVRGYRPGSSEAVALHAELDRVRGQIRELPNVINGERVPLGATVDVVAPHEHATVLGRFSPADSRQVDAAIAAALGARPDWSRTPWWDRAAVLLRAAELVGGTYRDELLATTMLGQSKTFHQAEIDAACELADFFRYNAHFAAQIYETQPPSPPGELNYLDQRGLEGFVLAITPFNFTAIGGNLPTTAALMGNTVVWKPSEKSALSSDVVMRVLEEAGLPPGVINLVHGSGADIADRALADENFAGVSFTGSTAVFRGLWKKIGTNIDRYRAYPRIVGETGGKNAVVAHPSADPEALLVALVRGAFEYQGQKCSAASRAYLPRSLWRDLEGRLADVVASLEVGDVTRHETFVGAVIDEAASHRLRSTIDAARALSGHRILTGGTVRTETGWFVDPTVFVTEDPTSFLMSEEFFGPLLTVHVYDDADWDKVLHQVDTASDYALTCSIFAGDRRAIGTALDALRDTAGMTYVNDKPTGALIGRQAFGGGRASGTNDKVGSPLALQRWVNARYVKENFAPSHDWTYPYMGR